MKPRTLNFKVYVEGVAIPFTNGSVSAFSGGVSQAVVTLPFSRYVTQLRPRTNIVFTYSYADDTLNNIPIEYLLFEGDMQSISVNGGTSSKTCTLTVTSPLESLKRYRQFVDTTITGEVSSMAQMLLYTDSEEVTEIPTDGVPFLSSSGRKLQSLLKTGSFPDSIQNNFKDIIQEGDIYSSVKIHEQYHNYMGQFEAMDIYDDDPLWKSFKTSVTWLKFIEGIDVVGNQNSPDFYSYMTQVYQSLHYQMTDIGVPHNNTTGSSISGEGPDVLKNGKKYSRYMIHASNPFINPPACNIIFPDIITNSNIDIQYAAEITRAALVQVPLVGGVGEVFNSLYAAPSSQFSSYTPGNSKVTKNTFLSSSRILGQFYGNNEYFLSPFGKYYNLPTWYTVTEEPEFDIGLTPDTLPGIHTTVTQWQKYVKSVEEENVSAFALRYADLTYLSDKYTSRRGSVNTVFNPKIAVGFPSVVVDNDLPFFGLVAGVTHSFNSSGSSQTSMNYTHVTTPLDYMNPDLRNANGVSEVLEESNISNVFTDIGLGDSFHDFVDTSFGVSDDVFRSLRELGFSLQRDDEAALLKSSGSTYTLKTDEKFSRLVDLQTLLDSSIKGTATDEALSLYLKTNSGRVPIQTSFKEGGNMAKDYWFNASEELTAIFNVRRRIAELLAVDLQTANPKTKIDTNIENSILSIVNDEICPKTQGEIDGLDLIPNNYTILDTKFRDPNRDLLA